MMKYIRAILRRMISILKIFMVKVLNPKSIKAPIIGVISPSTHFMINKGKITIGKKLQTRKNVEFTVNKGGKIVIGDNCFFNNNCIVAAHENIIIGNNCSFGPNVLIYDHDHDFRVANGKNEGKYKVSPIVIGDNVWIGANSVILRGSKIGDNSVIGAGTIIKTDIENDTIIYTKNEYERKQIKRGEKINEKNNYN